MRACPATAAAVTNYLSDRVHFFAHHAETLVLGGLAERVRRTLRALAERELDYGGSVSLRLTQGDLAALAGASRQRVNPILTALQRAGVLELKKASFASSRLALSSGLFAPICSVADETTRQSPA